MTDFKVGDKVVDANGHVWRVIGVDSGINTDSVTIVGLGNLSGFILIPKCLLKKLEEPKMAEFKVGDRVRLGEFQGVVLVENGNCIIVQWDNQKFGENTIHKDMLTKIAPKFEIGEKVLVEGMIDEIDSDGDIRFMTSAVGGNNTYCHPSPIKIRKLEQ